MLLDPGMIWFVGIIFSTWDSKIPKILKSGCDYILENENTENT